MNKRFLNIIAVTIIALLLYACTAPESAINVAPKKSYPFNFSSLYIPLQTDINPKIKIYNISSEETRLFYSLTKTDLLKLKQANSDTVELRIKYVVRKSDDFQTVDSAIVQVFFTLNDSIQNYVGNLKINSLSKQDSRLILNFIDKSSKISKRLFIYVDSNNELNSNDFMVYRRTEDDKDELWFDKYVFSNNIYRIKSNRYKSNNLLVEYYKFAKYVNLPPYYTGAEGVLYKNPDSVFFYKLNDTISFNNEGIYVFKSRAGETGIFCVMNFGENYPEIVMLKQMLEPIKLLVTNKEFSEIEKSENLKEGIDKFWLSLSKSQKIAREQIRVFYSRINLANVYFTDFNEGWKTDRGMLYVILGPPNSVRISKNFEEWFYGENPDIAGVLFVFDRLKNNFGENVFVLRRDVNYQPVWGQALATWRNGRIFSFKIN